MPRVVAKFFAQDSKLYTLHTCSTLQPDTIPEGPWLRQLLKEHEVAISIMKVALLVQRYSHYLSSMHGGLQVSEMSAQVHRFLRSRLRGLRQL